MDRRTKAGISLGGALAGISLIAWLLSEIRWASVNDPRGKFSTAAEYLNRGRLPGRVTRIDRKGQTGLIAHGPLDPWLAVPSCPAAYVFDSRGTLVDWSRDSGDDPGFNRRWPSPEQQDATLDELKKLSSRQEGTPQTRPR